MVAQSDIVILYFKYLGTTHIRPVNEIYRNPGTSYASQYSFTDHFFALSPHPKMSMEITASSMRQTAMTSANNPGLGTLSILPREIRDEIYRNLFKGHYCSYDSSDRMRSQTQKSDLALFSVSKATYDEGSSILYSESVFRLGFDYDPTIYPPEPTLRRIMKIELVFECCGCWHPSYSDTLNELNIGRTLRDSLTVISKFGALETGEALLRRLSEAMEAFKSFRTVTLKVSPDKYPCTGSNGEAERKYITRVIK